MDPISGNVFAAECILKERKRKGKKEFLIKWKGWNSKWNSWEPSGNILDDRLFDEFESKKKGKGQSPRKRTSTGRSADRSASRRPAKLRKAPAATRQPGETEDKDDKEEDEEIVDEKEDDVEGGECSSVGEEDKASTSQAQSSKGEGDAPTVAPLVIKLGQELTPTLVQTASSSDDDSSDSDSSDESEATDDEPLSSLARTSIPNPAPPSLPKPPASPAPASKLLPVNSGSSDQCTVRPPTIKKVVCSREDLLQTGGFSNCTLTDVHVRDTTVTFLEL